MESFDALIQQAHQQAEVVGLTRADIANAVARARGKT
jgi:hypothetical protein